MSFWNILFVSLVMAYHIYPNGQNVLHIAYAIRPYDLLTFTISINLLFYLLIVNYQLSKNRS